jgi:hypothetical protein
MGAPSEPTTGLLLLRHGDGELHVQVTWPSRPAPERPAAVVAGPPGVVAHVSSVLGRAGLLTLAIETDSPNLPAIAEVMSWYAAHAADLDAGPGRSFVVVELGQTLATD